MNVIDQKFGRNFAMYNGDCVEVVRGIPEHSVGFAIFSPPFASLYTYSNSARDMGNCKTDEEFMENFSFLVEELARVMMPGRIVAFHCMNLPTSKERDGFIGIKDFRGELIRCFQKSGFIFHSETCIWKDPLIAATRTKALGLMHKQLCKDSALSRCGIPDYLVAVRAPGENPQPIRHPDGLTEFYGENEPTSGNLSHERWRRYASPVWMDINPSNTLQKESAREHDDERHICPLQLDVIDRGIHLWSNPGDVVLSPFAGIGSEGHEALRLGRRFIGIELKKSYFDQAVKNLVNAENIAESGTLFD
ncbi:DNA methyltransferase [uncultured Victivallis sp.]|uniref:DNA-methyltransferase n=1 Tax=uncultured Victivallis sp. TaxID=354118 RepID=UPI0025851994|nr:DNA methyltransferase [uncultured Victivallis sp.]